MKGQHLIVEEMFLFSMGLFIALGFLLTFQTFGKDAREMNMETGLKLIAEYLQLKSIKISNLNGDGRLKFSMPREIFKKPYFAEMNDKINVYSEKQSYSTKLMGMEEKYNYSGRISSSMNEFYLDKNGKNISLGGKG